LIETLGGRNYRDGPTKDCQNTTLLQKGAKGQFGRTYRDVAKHEIKHPPVRKKGGETLGGDRKGGGGGQVGKTGGDVPHVVSTPQPKYRKVF